MRSRIKTTLGVKVEGSVEAVEIKVPPCDCFVEVTHNAVMEFIEERVFVDGSLLGCDTPMTPECLLGDNG